MDRSKFPRIVGDMSETKIHHMMSEVGRAACGQNLGYVDQGGEVGGDLPPRTWDVYHVAESAVGLLKWIDQYGAADACWSCSLAAQEAATRRGSFRLGLAPAWAADRDTFSSRVALAWPVPEDEAAMSADEWEMRR